MLSSTGRAFMQQAPWLATFPGLAISLAVLAFNLFGDILCDAWDPSSDAMRPTSSRKTVPPWAMVKRPGLRSTAPGER